MMTTEEDKQLSKKNKITMIVLLLVVACIYVAPFLMVS